MDDPSADRLDSWKQIATYLGRSVRTVERWEREEALPVHRLQHEKRGSVFALKSELDAWRKEKQFTAVATGLEPTGKKGRLSWMLAASATILTGVAGWAWLSRPAAAPHLVPLTGASGIEQWPSFSPDGRSIAYAWTPDGEKRRNLYVKLIGAGDPLRLTADASILWPAWSPDGRHIAYYKAGAPASVCVIPALGGVERRITGIDPLLASWGRPAWFPDGSRLVISDTDPATGVPALFELSVETGERRQIVAAAAENGSARQRSPTAIAGPLLFRGDVQPAVSPDGQWLVFVRFQAWGVRAIYLARTTGGEPRPLTPTKQLYWAPAWSADGRSILYAASGGLWRMDASGGPPERIAHAGEDVFGVVAAPAGDRIAVSRQSQTANLWRLTLDSPETPVQVAGTSRSQRNPSFSPDGKKLAFESNRKGASEVWTSDIDGSHLTQLTFMEALAGTPRWSPDGSEIAFDARQAGNADIFIVNAAGGTPRRLTSDAAEDMTPSFSSDGRWIYFSSSRGGAFDIWKVPRGGGDAVRVTQHGGLLPAESPDGQFLYYAKPEGSRRVWRSPVAGGSESVCLAEQLAGGKVWRIVSRGLVYAKGNAIRLLEPETGRTTDLARIPKPPLDIAVSPDGRTIVYAMLAEVKGSIVLVERFH